MAKRASDDTFRKMQDLRDELLVPVEEWSTDDVFDIVSRSGLDIDAVKRRLYESASDIAGSYYSQNKDVPAHLADLLQQVRPADRPPQDPKVASKSATTWIKNILRRGVRQPPELEFSFRNADEDIAPDDLKVLDELARKLKENTEESD